MKKPETVNRNRPKIELQWPIANIGHPGRTPGPQVAGRCPEQGFDSPPSNRTRASGSGLSAADTPEPEGPGSPGCPEPARSRAGQSGRLQQRRKPLRRPAAGLARRSDRRGVERRCCSRPRPWVGDDLQQLGNLTATAIFRQSMLKTRKGSGVAPLEQGERWARPPPPPPPQSGRPAKGIGGRAWKADESFGAPARKRRRR